MNLSIDLEPGPDDTLSVQLFEARPNHMFSEEQRRAVRFLRFNRAVACAACGRKSKHHWTALHSFFAVDFEHSGLAARKFDKTFAPLTPVCRRHPFGVAAWPPPARPLVVLV